jgi:hypothetical protein
LTLNLTLLLARLVTVLALVTMLTGLAQQAGSPPRSTVAPPAPGRVNGPVLADGGGVT